MTLRFRTFRARLVALFGALLVLVLAASFLAVNRASVANAERVVREDLEEDAAVFRRLFEDRTQRLLEAARLLSSDYAFKVVYADGDPGTILSAMENFLSRTGDADAMLLLSLDGDVLADTAAPESDSAESPWPWLIAEAEEDDWGEAAGVVIRAGRPLQMMVVPLLAPDLEAWILIGFELDDEYTADLAELILSEVSILHHDAGDACHNVASTLDAERRARVAASFQDGELAMEGLSMLAMAGEPWLSTAIPISRSDESRVLVALQRSLAAELAPYARLRTVLLALFLASLALSIVAAFAIARSVSRPVLELAEGARHIEEGDYSRRVAIERLDEIGTLASSFNQMAEGLEEKERVRDLLGKVVSPAIAEELLSKKIELGGEERVVTILFSDVRNFTTLCEGRSPREILSLLNLYLTEVSEIVEQHGGVVDKYIGDAVMALFGAPLDHPDSAGRAVATALGMSCCLDELNAKFRAQGLPELGIGVGVNTDLVVVGNMGSENRLNYTVIGDGVNLASRLEGLTKRYRIQVIASEATKQAAPEFVFRELDRVRVKGKSEAVRIWEPLGRVGEVAEEALAALKRFRAAQALIRERRFGEARLALDELAAADAGGAPLYGVYAERATTFEREPPAEGWDGTVEFSTK